MTELLHIACLKGVSSFLQLAVWVSIFQVVLFSLTAFIRAVSIHSSGFQKKSSKNRAILSAQHES